MTSAREPLVISDDLPEAYVRFIFGNRIARDATVFSRPDALRQREARRGNPKQYHPHGRSRRGRAVR